MGLRTDGREAAVQFLFANELHEQAGNKSESEKEEFWQIHHAKPAVREFAELLINGVLQDLPAIDRHISAACTNFSIDRLANVDRNILRVAVHELLHTTLGAAIIISEAIEVAKRLGAPESSRFVNGVIDRIAREVRGQEVRVKRPKPQPAE